jgi:hypothetical protein
MTLASYHSRQVALATVGFLVGGIVVAIAAARVWASRRRGPTRRMRGPARDAIYHQLTFDQTIEASAFMAALSRFLASPAGVTMWPDVRTYEVWSRSIGGRTELFLSDGALAMAKEAFSPMPTTKAVRGTAIPRDTSLSLTGFGIVPMGVDQMSRQLEQSS